MSIKNLIIEDFPVVHPYTGTNAIENILLKKKFIVVKDEQNLFYGVLTASDIIERPHKLVIDCIGNTEKVDVDENVVAVYHKMVDIQRCVLPVFQEDSFLGIINFQQIMSSISNEKEITKTQLQKIEQDLKEEKEKAHVVERLKNAFLQNISHEIRTPLNGLVGFAEILSSSQFEDFQKKKFYESISKSSHRFLETINEIIEISRIQSGDIQLKKYCTCSASSVIEELYQHYLQEKKIIDKAHIDILTNKDEKDVVFSSDISKVKQILSYVIHNALKFTKKGVVEIGYKRDEENVIFFVRDTGPGIPAEMHDKIFIAFEKNETENDLLLPGIGLGLTIAKYLANYLNGNIWFDSEIGAGSTFYISFPV